MRQLSQPGGLPDLLTKIRNQCQKQPFKNDKNLKKTKAPNAVKLSRRG